MYVNRAIIVLSSLSLAVASQIATAQTYSITDIGVLPGGTTSEAWGINNSGQVAGMSTSANGQRAFLWSSGSGLLDLGDRPGGTNGSWGTDVNDSAQVTGNATNIAFRWSSGTGMDLLGFVPGGDSSYGWGINNLGNVCGYSVVPQGQSFPSHPFYWSPQSGMLDIGMLAGHTRGNALDVNDQNQVVGWSATGSTNGRAYLWSQSGGMLNLGVLSGHTFSMAYGINEVGQVVGSSRSAQGNTVGDRAILWTQAEGMQSLGVLSGAAWSYAFDINESGQVVGTSDQAFLWTQGAGMISLKSLCDSSAANWFLTEARAINDAGQIVGYGMKGGVQHAFLASPVPEPATMAALGFGAVALLRRRRKQV